jgi:hypothetical protein
MHVTRRYESRLVRAAGLGLAVVVLLAGCSGVRKYVDKINTEGESYYGLQTFIRDQLTTKFHRSVRSVSCLPHVDQVLPGQSANLRCLVRFTNGSSYTSQATIDDPSSDPDTAVNNYSFENPPGYDITTAPLPRPTVTLPATSPRSLLAAPNLAPVVRRLKARLGHDIFVQLEIYPGELEGVVAANGAAHAVSVTAAGVLTVGPTVSFIGSRNGIGFSQLVPGVIQRLTHLVVTRGHVRPGAIKGFVLVNSLPHGNSGWTIHLNSAYPHFLALVLGQDLVEITLHSRRPLT